MLVVHLRWRAGALAQGGRCLHAAGGARDELRSTQAAGQERPTRSALQGDNRTRRQQHQPADQRGMRPGAWLAHAHAQAQRQQRKRQVHECAHLRMSSLIAHVYMLGGSGSRTERMLDDDVQARMQCSCQPIL